MESLPPPDAYGYLIHVPKVAKWAYDNQIIDMPKKELAEARKQPYFYLLADARTSATRAFLRYIRKETGIPIGSELVYVGAGRKVMRIWSLPWSYAEEPLDDEKRDRLEKLKVLLDTQDEPSYWYVDDGYNQCPAFIQGLDFPEEWKPFDPVELPKDQLF